MKQNHVSPLPRTVGFGVLLLLWMLTPWASATAQPSDDPSPHSEAALVSEVETIAPGEPFTVAMHLQMDDGWHSYWKNAGDSGMASSIDWNLPEGFSAGEIQWPHPTVKEEGPLVTYGYSGEIMLLVDITPPDDLESGTEVTLAGRGDWLICEDICLPAHADLETTLSVDADATPDAEWDDAFAQARAQHPRPAEGVSVQAYRSDGSFVLELEGDDLPDEGVRFIPGEKRTISNTAPQPVMRDGDTRYLALQASEYADGSTESLRGVLLGPDGFSWSMSDRPHPALAVDAPLEGEFTGDLSALSEAGTGASSTSLSLWGALGFAFIGGLLLNLMPCVFPVISLKILGFAKKSGEQPRIMRRHGGLFAAGVVVSFWVLAGLLLALRAAGEQIGWGFQLQSPGFIALMALLFVGIGLNLSGLFELGTRLTSVGGTAQQKASGYSESFLTGVLATIVATPCTAPLMGAALGVALTMSAVEAMSIFTALGVGMAAPYVVLSSVPALLNRLPKPGPWMETMKQLLAFPMFATALWLVWVFGQQVSIDGVALLLGAFLLLGLAGWVLGRWPAMQVEGRTWMASRAVVTTVVAGALALALLGAGTGAPASASTQPTDANWQSFSTEQVDAVRDEGTPVFIDFTAAWCLTCQVNKRTTLSTESVQQAFDDKGVHLVRADWTNRNDEITQALSKFNRSGVPLYVLYPGDGSDPVLLPEVLTPQIVMDALNELPDTRNDNPELASERP
ncbi:protein-disulfide reductase DsbD family protein [Longimonas halophila]|nr:thioredoxin family protein [Longimonas halophila]